MDERHVALVTGGSRGIGRAICEVLAREGAAVFVAARDRAACDETARSIRERGGVAWPLALDVADPASIESALAEARSVGAALGPVDWLVNDAGIAISSPVVPREEDRDAAERMLQVNFHGARRLCEALVPDMLQRGYGRIVNVASSAGLRGYAYAAAYCASKHALVGYTLAAALELAPRGIAVNAVCPHYVDSPMTDANVGRIVGRTGRSEADVRAFLAGQNPGGRLVDPLDVAHEVWRLLESDVAGVLVELDGGERPHRRAAAGEGLVAAVRSA